MSFGSTKSTENPVESTQLCDVGHRTERPASKDCRKRGFRASGFWAYASGAPNIRV